MRTLPLFVLGLAIVATSGGATDCGAIIDDSGFDLWCGDRLCRWDLEKGQVAQAPTWHRDDHGVELIGADVALSQLTEVTSGDGRCVAFDLVADVAADAEVFLEIDLYGDGSVERIERIPTSDWRPVGFRLGMPARYQGVRFRLTKTGGHAVLANLGAEIADDAECVGEPIAGGPAPAGATCLAPAECASGRCVPTEGWPVCAACEVDADCPDGGVCGLDPIAPANLALAPTCLAAGSTATGLACRGDAQCATGICAGGVCSTCRSSADCGGASCARITYPVADGATVVGGARCLGAAPAPTGAACLGDDECASGRCVGEPHRVCQTGPLGRSCDRDSDCPGFAFATTSACVTVGVRGGTCQ